MFVRLDKTEKLFFFLFLFGLVCLFFYSYTQIDLGLVITKVPWLYSLEKSFQQIGYFNRQLSTLLYIFITVYFVILYFFLLRFFKQNKLSTTFLWLVVGATSCILIFAYNAFSYDLFNYIFDAKIVTHYHQNPYVHKALDYPADPMLGFMHWTQRTYPYGPFWLILTVPLSYIGGNIFILTFFLFKLLLVGSYTGTIYFIYKILHKLQYTKPNYLTAIFAFHPLVLYEWGVSAHNDGVMIMFACWAVYMALEKKYWLGFLLLFLSIAIKFATVFLLPIFVFIYLKRQKLDGELWKKSLVACFLFMFIPLFLVIARTNFQPWYLLYLLPFLPFIPQRSVQLCISVLGIIALAIYLPFLYFGNWNSFLYTIQTTIYYWLSFIALVIGCFLFYKMVKTKATI